MDTSESQRAWTGAVAPLLAALAAREVCVAGHDPICALARAQAGTVGYALTAEPGPATDAIVAAGEAPREMVERWESAGGWEARTLDGLWLLVRADRLASEIAVHAVWSAIGAVADAGQRHADLERAMTGLLDELDARLDSDEAATRALSDSLTRIGATISAAARREQLLEHRATSAEALAAAARGELTEERRWVAAQARGVARSQSWRLGHRLVRGMRLLTLRRDRGTDAVEGIAVRMERGLKAGDPGEGQPG